MSRKIATNTFSEGMIKDLNPLTTPNNVLTDALNATFITYNGNEFVLQNDMGNCKVERARLSPGFIPVGMKEYGGIIYVASMNPETGNDEVGSFPSPERDFSTTDFEFSSPVAFETSDFIVQTTTTVTEKLKSVGKLMEPSVFQLKPGDKYVVLYDIHLPEMPIGDPIEDQTDMDKYISKDVLNRKLFKLKFYKINDDNNQLELDPDEIKVIPNQENIDDEYVFFKENSKGVLAVGLELETLDMFEANVVNRSRKTEIKKTVGIEAVGFSNSLANFEGVRVDVTSPEIKTFFIDKVGTGKKVAATVSDLEVDKVFKATLTPYSKYSLFPQLKKAFEVDLGATITAGSGVNNIYRWKTYDKYLKLDFDFAFEGDSAEGLQLYVEFYDPWSDYSVVKLVDNPTYYGTNQLTLDLVDEPAVDIFNSLNVGGTPAIELTANADTNHLKTILNSTNTIRKNSSLRKNHFYIVRISGVEKINGAYNHYDLYKGLYTTTMFNKGYDTSLQLSAPNPLLDFNNYEFDLKALKFESKVINSTDQIIPATDQIEVGEVFTDVKNSKFYYLLKPVSDITPVETDLITSRIFKRESTKDIKIELKGTETVFGDFKNELITIIPPVNNNSTSTVVDTGWDGNTLTTPESLATVNIANVSSNVYKVKASLTTKRKLATETESSVVIGYDFAPNTDGGYPLAKKLAYYEGATPIPSPNVNDGAPIDTPAAMSLTLRMGNTTNSNRKEMWARLAWRLPIGVDLRTGWAEGIHNNGPLMLETLYDVNKLYQDIETMHAGDLVRYSGYWTHVNFANIYNQSDNDLNAQHKEKVKYYYPGAPAPYNHEDSKNATPTRSWGNAGLLTMRSDNNKAYFIPMGDFEKTKKFFEDLRVGYKLKRNYKVYAYDNATIFETGNVTTTATFSGIQIASKFTPINSTRTYLSKFRQRAKGVVTDFSDVTINAYIQERINLFTSVIVDDKKTIKPNLIPFIDNEITIQNPIVVDPLIITQSSDAATMAKIKSGKSDAAASPTLSDPPSYVRPHGELFSVNPTITQSLLRKFKVYPNFTSDQTPVNPDELMLTLNSTIDKGGEVVGTIRHGAWSKPHRGTAYFVALLVDPIYRQ